MELARRRDLDYSHVAIVPIWIDGWLEPLSRVRLTIIVA
jgi:hypothetical protein